MNAMYSCSDLAGWLLTVSHTHTATAARRIYSRTQIHIFIFITLCAFRRFVARIFILLIGLCASAIWYSGIVK